MNIFWSYALVFGNFVWAFLSFIDAFQSCVCGAVKAYVAVKMVSKLQRNFYQDVHPTTILQTATMNTYVCNWLSAIQLNCNV